MFASSLIVYPTPRVQADDCVVVGRPRRRQASLIVHKLLVEGVQAEAVKVRDGQVAVAGPTR